MDNHRPITLSNSREPHLVPIASLKPYDRHLRRHSKAKIEKLKKLVVHFGQVTPIIVDENNVIIDGHALHSAMCELGAGEIAVISIAGRSAADIRALRLALNRLPQEAAWDNESLRTELQELVDLSFDLDLTGFNAPEIDQILELDYRRSMSARTKARSRRSARLRSPLGVTSGNVATTGLAVGMHLTRCLLAASLPARKPTFASSTRPTTCPSRDSSPVKAGCSTASSFRQPVRCRLSNSRHSWRKP